MNAAFNIRVPSARDFVDTFEHLLAPPSFLIIVPKNNLKLRLCLVSNSRPLYAGQCFRLFATAANYYPFIF